MSPLSTTFAIRLDEKTAEALRRLAADAERRRGDYLRLLIRREAQQLTVERAGISAPPQET